MPIRRCLPVGLSVVMGLASQSALAGPETAMREFASGQIKKGVRSIGMGGDGATWGNYALVYRDANTALFDYGSVVFQDTANRFTFAAVGFTSPTFWDDAALYVIGLSQHATNLKVWALSPFNASKPPSQADGSNQAVFIKFAKPLTKTLSVGFLGSYELSQMTLIPFNNSAPIRFETAWRPSGGAGVFWQPEKWLVAGTRIILNHDEETRVSGASHINGLVRSYEYRAGVSALPWPGGLLDVGAVALSRSNELEKSYSFNIHPTLGAEQALVRKRVWIRAGLDETSWAAGMSVKATPFKLDIAYLKNLAEARTGDVFGKRNVSLIGTLTFDYGAI